MISFVLTFLWFRDGLIMAAGESGIAFYNLKQMLGITRYSWADPALGNFVGVGIAATPTFWFLAQLQSFGVPGFVIQGLFFGVVFAVSGISIFILTRQFFPNLRPRYLLLSTFFYWFNFVSLVNVWNRLLYNFMVFWALLPLAIFLFIKGIKRQDFRYSMATALATTLFSFSLTSSVFSILLWGLLLYVIIFYFIVEKNRRLYLAKYGLLCLVTFTLLNFWWITQFFSFIFSDQIKPVIEEYFTIEGNLSTLSSLSQRLGGLVYLIRLKHATFFEEGPTWVGIYNLPLFILLEYLVSFVILFTVYKFRKVEEVLFLGILFLWVIFLAKGNAVPFGEVFQFFFIKIPAIQVFRNSFEKFGFVLPVALTPLFAFSISKISRDISIFRLRKLALFGSFLYIILLAYPFLSSKVFTYRKVPKEVNLQSYKTKVPGYYKVVGDWFVQQKEDFRFLALPLGGEGITQTWEKSYSGSESSSALFSNPNISFNTSIPFYSKIVGEISNYQLNERLLDFFPFINAKYILWRGDIDYKERKMANPGNSKRILNDWEQKGLIKNQLGEGELSVYEVDNKWLWPKIYTTSNIFITNSSDLSELSSFATGFPSKKVAYVTDYRKTKPSYLNENTRKIIIPKEKIIIKMTTPLPKNLSEEDLLGRLFHAEHSPDKWFYPLVRIKERLGETSKDDYYGWIIYKTGILGKRAVEVYKLYQKGGVPRVILNAESDYRKELDVMKSDLLGFVGSKSPISELIKDSLSYQWVLLDRVGSKESDYLSDLLINWGIKPKFELPVSDMDYIVYALEIPEGGSYEISLGEKEDVVKRIFVDGGEVDLLHRGPIMFSEGEHEVALVLEESSENPIIDISEIELSTANLFSQPFDIPNLPTTYSVEFDYRFVEGDSFEIHFVQDIDRDVSPVFASGVRKDKSYHGWRHYNKEFTTTPGADLGELSILPTEEEICSKFLYWEWSCIKKELNFNVEIRNLKLAERSFPELKLVSNLNQEIQLEETGLEFQKVDPTEYKVNVHKRKDEIEILVFSELFNSGWEARFADGTKIPNDRHFLVNTYANGWLFERVGDYEITLKFRPQELLDKGKWISAISTSLSIVVVGVLSWKKRKKV